MNLSRTCRTCLQQIIEELVPIPESLYDFLEQRMLINRVPRLHPNLELPQNVCFDCYRNLITFKRFHTQCRDAEEFLQIKLEEAILKIKQQNESNEDGKTEICRLEGNMISHSSEDSTNFYDFEVLQEEEQSEADECVDFTVFHLDSSVTHNQQENDCSTDADDLQKFANESIIIVDLDEDEETTNGNSVNSSYQHNTGVKQQNIDQSDDNISKKRRFECNVCAKRFSSRYDLQTHEYIHTGIKPFPCDICGKSFRQKNVLRTHQTLHFGKTIKCEICDKTFARKSQLILHDRMHRNLKPFKCDFDKMCGAEFRERQHLVAHQKIHIGLREHQCELCPSAFYHRKGLLSHVRDVHGRLCYKCNFCSRSFNKPYKLRRHLQSLHDVCITDVSEFKTTISANDLDSEEVDDINIYINKN